VRVCQQVAHQQPARVPTDHGGHRARPPTATRSLHAEGAGMLQSILLSLLSLLSLLAEAMGANSTPTS
jgi:hypothetical protein